MPATGQTSENLGMLQRDIAEMGDFDIPLADGQTIRASELLDDLEADQVLDTVVSLCAAKGGAG